MGYDGEVRESDWCSNHACYRWQCPSPTANTDPPPVESAQDHQHTWVRYETYHPFTGLVIVWACACGAETDQRPEGGA